LNLKLIGILGSQMETINKLLKKQAPKVNKKAAAAAAAAAAAGGEATPQDSGPKASPVFVRWVSSKNGTRVSVPTEMLEGPVGKVFRTEKDAVRAKRMVDEVA
jgi:Ino eighty subunit 2